MALAIVRVAVAVGVASLAVAYQENVLRSASPAAEAAPSELAAPAPVMRSSATRARRRRGERATRTGWIVSAGADATVRLWSGTSGALVRTIELSEGAVTAFAVDARRALVGHKGGTIVLWDLEQGERLATVQHGDEAITSLAFLGEGFVAARQDGSVALFEAATQATPAASSTARMAAVRWSPRRTPAACSSRAALDRTVRVWRAPGPRLARTYQAWRTTSPPSTLPPTAAMWRAAAATASSESGPTRPCARLAGAHRPDAQGPRRSRDRDRARPAGALATAGTDGSVKVWSLRPAPRGVAPWCRSGCGR